MLSILCFRVATSIPTALHHKDGRIVVLGTDPVQQHPQTQVFCLAKAQTVIDQLKTKSRSMRQGKEVCCSINVQALCLREWRQSVGQIAFHAGWIVSIHKQWSGEPAEHKSREHWQAFLFSCLVLLGLIQWEARAMDTRPPWVERYRLSYKCQAAAWA